MSAASTEAQQRTRAFARVIGPYITIFTTVYAIRLPEMDGPNYDLFTQPVLVLTLGALMLGGGLVIIGCHRSWRGPIAVTISLFGWFVAVRGFLLIATPTAIRSGVDVTMHSPIAITLARIFFGLLALLGVLLTRAGWYTRSTDATSPTPATTDNSA